jgi:hypothetical protein
VLSRRGFQATSNPEWIAARFLKAIFESGMTLALTTGVPQKIGYKGVTHMAAVAERTIEAFEYGNQHLKDFTNIANIFGRPKTVCLHVKAHFTTLDTQTDPENLIAAAKRDGEWYVGLTPLILYADWDCKQVKVTIPDRGRVVISNGQTYQKGIDGYQDGYNYVRLSALGLRAALNGDTLEIV